MVALSAGTRQRSLHTMGAGFAGEDFVGLLACRNERRIRVWWKPFCMTPIVLTTAEAVSVHDRLAGLPTPLDELIARTRSAAGTGSVIWRAPVNAETVHR